MGSDLAKQYHSINIGVTEVNSSTGEKEWTGKNTWDDWHLVPTSRPLVSAPQVKTSFIDLPGADGSLDMTTALAGRPTYNRRSGSWEFLVMNDYFDWTVLYSEIMLYLQGKEFEVILEDDPGYYYIGRLAVNQWRSDPNWSKIVINYNFDPYKRDVSGFGDNWLWDPFNFETGIIRTYKDLVVETTLTITFINEMMSVSPNFISSVDGLQMETQGKTYTLAKGNNIFPDLVYEGGEHTIVFTGNGTVTIESVGGRL